MSKQPGFFRVAIWPNGLSPTVEHLVEWYKQAGIRGADMFYLRIPSAELLSDQALGFIDEHATKFILPATFQLLGVSPGAWHAHSCYSWTPVMGAINGRSCHSIDELKQAKQAGYDYAFFSPVFSTNTHPDAVPLGLDRLREACNSTDLPIFALGGITTENMGACLSNGAFGIAAIGMYAKG